MNKTTCIELAKQQINDFELDGYIVFQYKPETRTKVLQEVGLDIDYDYVCFNDYQELKDTLVNRKGYDYLDNFIDLEHYNYICAYSKSHIIIL